jgi:hypothetical protein
MRPPRAIPLFLTLIALALPAGAQIKTNAGADAASAGSGQVGSSFNAGGVAPIGLAGGTISPLSLSPAFGTSLSAPAVSHNLALAPSAMAAQVVPAAAAQDRPIPKAVAAAPIAAPQAVPSEDPALIVERPLEFFVHSLRELGVPRALTDRLMVFLDARHPGDHNKIYHGLGHTRAVANLTANIVEGQNLSAEKKILLILSGALHDVDPDRPENTPARVSATLAHLDGNDEARALLMDFGVRYGFTAAQVKALIMATDFSLDAAQMKEKQDAFAKAAKEAFPSEPEWPLIWGKRLAFADQTATYIGTPAEARQHVEGLALEIRTQLEPIGAKGPSNEIILAGTYKFLSELKRNPEFALLPEHLRERFDTVRAYFEKGQTPEAWAAPSAPVPARAPPVSPDLASAKRYINEIFGGSRAPTEREADSLLGDWLDENNIPRGSDRAAKVREGLLPAKAQADADAASKLDPALRRHSALLIRIAAERKVTVAYVESVIVKRGLLQYLGDIPDASLETQIELALTNAELERAVSKYPDNPQGELMRAVAGAMGAKGGKSVEEVARDGVFLYADFNGNRFTRGYASRDPDIQSHTIAFYVTRKDGKWRVDGYRQKAHGKSSDQTYIDGLKAWLRAGGIPSSDFR